MSPFLCRGARRCAQARERTATRPYKDSNLSAHGPATPSRHPPHCTQSDTALPQFSLTVRTTKDRLLIMLIERDYMRRKPSESSLQTPSSEPPMQTQSSSLKPLFFVVAFLLLVFGAFWQFRPQAPQSNMSLQARTIPSMPSSTPQKIATKIIEDKSEVPAHSLRSWTFPMMTQRTTIRWHLEADSPVHLLLFPTQRDHANYLAHQPYNTYTCSAQNVSLSEGSCTIEPQGVFALDNRADASARIALSVTAQ